MNNTAASKTELRRIIAKKISQLSIDCRKAESDKVMKIIESLPEFQSATAIMCYHSMPNELGTQEAIKRWAETKTVVLPRVKGDDLLLLEFSPDKLDIGRYGICEPSLDCSPVNLSEIQLVIVPGVGFDVECNRMGHGKGFYDRLLSNKDDATKLIGVAFDCQIVHSVPHCDHDIRMDKVISASHTYIKP